jgi:hypothetical protein
VRLRFGDNSFTRSIKEISTFTHVSVSKSKFE